VRRWRADFLLNGRGHPLQIREEHFYALCLFPLSSFMFFSAFGRADGGWT